MKAMPRREGRKPWRGKAQESIGATPQRWKHRGEPTDSRMEQSPEGGLRRPGTVLEATTRGQGTSRGGPAVREGKALEGEPRRCLSGEKNRQGSTRSKPSGGGGTL